MDVYNVFLHDDLSKEVYMRLAPGFTKGPPGLACKLHKSLYGLKQAPRCSFSKLVTTLEKCGFVQSYSDYSMFTLSKGSLHLHVLVYVDDLIISALLGAKPVGFPKEQNQRLAGSTSPLLQDVERYRRLVGRLIYLSFTCPDLSFGVQMFSQFLHEARQDH
ncbi:hypothetical protein LIER_35526 [Lithospermum erythrorhizon]|uniref:Reverse transcriptase Ty1/copia-type domain-containing protein n=1 Tax=Lithospermum erythrorhizon TaxID=34254 RepID=A0AAV3NWR9_LITER